MYLMAQEDSAKSLKQDLPARRKSSEKEQQVRLSPQSYPAIERQNYHKY